MNQPTAGTQDVGVVKKVDSSPITAAGAAYQGNRRFRTSAMPTGTNRTATISDLIAWPMPALDTTAGYRSGSST